jgi:hypothetical protein
MLCCVTCTPTSGILNVFRIQGRINPCLSIRGRKVACEYYLMKLRGSLFKILLTCYYKGVYISLGNILQQNGLHLNILRSFCVNNFSLSRLVYVVTIRMHLFKRLSLRCVLVSVWFLSVSCIFSQQTIVPNIVFWYQVTVLNDNIDSKSKYIPLQAIKEWKRYSSYSFLISALGGVSG